MSFTFGKNWRRYLNQVTDEQLRIAQKSLTDYFGMADFKGKTFLDVCSGSGIFSYAAFQLGAEQVVSFDYDPDSVACTEAMRHKAGDPANWRVFKGSVLNMAEMEKLGRFDLVYAWGVLHHTGSMWQAIKNTLPLVASNGSIYLGIYNNVPGRFGSSLWLNIVKRYNRSSSFVKYLMEEMYVFVFIIKNLLRLKNPWAKMREHKKRRGMDWRIDVVDDLGGYPYEYASAEELFHFVKKNFPSFDLVKMRLTQDRGNNKYVFIRRS